MAKSDPYGPVQKFEALQPVRKQLIGWSNHADPAKVREMCRAARRELGRIPSWCYRDALHEIELVEKKVSALEVSEDLGSGLSYAAPIKVKRK